MCERVCMGAQCVLGLRDSLDVENEWPLMLFFQFHLTISVLQCIPWHLVRSPTGLFLREECDVIVFSLYNPQGQYFISL